MLRHALALCVMLIAGCGAADSDSEVQNPEPAPASDTPTQASSDQTESPGAAALNGLACKSTSRCALWTNQRGTFRNGKFLWCGC